MNPCPCGYYNHPTKSCACQPGAVFKYLNKISGPLLDRIDLHVEVVPVAYGQGATGRCGESSQQIRARVMMARERQRRRYEEMGIYCNAQMGTRLLRRWCRVDKQGEELLRNAVDRLGFSMRAHDHILKIGRTIADLAGMEKIQLAHLAEAIQFRNLDRDGWAG
jgi:magnesium chelatase family protein